LVQGITQLLLGLSYTFDVVDEGRNGNSGLGDGLLDLGENTRFLSFWRPFSNALRMLEGIKMVKYYVHNYFLFNIK
jgi:hypothetical protein